MTGTFRRAVDRGRGSPGIASACMCIIIMDPRDNTEASAFKRRLRLWLETSAAAVHASILFMYLSVQMLQLPGTNMVRLLKPGVNVFHAHVFAAQV